MSGQYPGQFGPPPGGAPTGGIPGTAPQPYAPTMAVPPRGPGRQVGPYGVLGRVLVVLAPLLTVGLLGMVPSLLLAIRRRRAYDILGAVVFAGLFLTFFICIGIAGSYPKGDAPVADAVGTTTMVLMWFTPPVHFLLMDRQVVWGAGRPAAPTAAYPPPAGYGYPSPATPAQPYPAAQPYGATQSYPAAQPYAPAPSYGAAQPYSAAQPYGTPAPYPQAAQPQPPVQPQPSVAHPPVQAGGAGAGGAGPATSDELRELGELLRRQAREDRP
ncbi:hypothetical protein ACFP3U_20175 [Kitasatospora misakiensis]|uniref:Integral membrane protein n=1 Tax=Kitasatospora misakiensis TaxID=67330 RepID=A0ABW0X7R8_9ACTN